MKLNAFILAGGKSSRMGVDKGLVHLSGKPMIQYIIDTLEQLKLPIQIVSNSSEYKSFGHPVFEDLISDKGPIGGIYTALNHSDSEMNLIISCDTPFVNPALIESLIAECKNQNVTISEYEGWQHPLIGIYSKRGIKTFQSQIEKDELKLSKANELLNAKAVPMDNIKGITARTFDNINTIEELKEAGN
ncbi:MAG: molybdopterin-guanine dinucleotide biosynthesis protein A [Crocinitomicaceae bacterium]|jgi:molybdopterin-guanine dinucleotide biosynthesis protein A